MFPTHGEKGVPTRSKGNLKCSEEKSLHASNSCPKYVILSPLDLAIAFGTILYHARKRSDAIPMPIIHVIGPYLPHVLWGGCDADFDARCTIFKNYYWSTSHLDVWLIVIVVYLRARRGGRVHAFRLLPGRCDARITAVRPHPVAFHPVAVHYYPITLFSRRHNFLWNGCVGQSTGELTQARDSRRESWCMEAR